ncbi:hypothetical protein [Pantoea sp. 1B4]|uniref:hypothetical protein n=1 Tax=Pantoea sp. 1B4 TaxID=2804760 RepID=UPI001AA33F5C|nr:hypothetical protein [Pantoea sp. 1B4]MBN1088081.1 hypothetical protein [Pantoea sp. 1B4]
MSDKKYPSNLYLESVTTSVDFASHVSVEAVVVMAKELLALRKATPCQHQWDTLKLVECGGSYQYCKLCGIKKVAD